MTDLRSAPEYTAAAPVRPARELLAALTYPQAVAWIAGEASLEQLKWFFEQEAAGEAGFDDLVALTQVKLPAGAKLELARNYWDEMGYAQQTY